MHMLCFHSGIMVLTQFLHAECKLISSWDNYYLSLTVVVLFMTNAQQAVVQEDVWKRKRHWWAVRRLLYVVTIGEVNDILWYILSDLIFSDLTSQRE